MSPRNLKYMRRFAEVWAQEEFVQQVAAQLPSLVLALTPKAKIALGKSESEELADAIIEIASAMKQLEKTVAGNFNASEATVSVDVEQATDGKLQVVAGGAGKSTNAHTLKLIFRPS